MLSTHSPRSDSVRRGAPLSLALALGLSLLGCKSPPEESSPKASASAPAPAPAPEELIQVTAAADLALAFKEVGEKFENKTHHKVNFAFGSTGMAAKQLMEGAPFDLFAAANVSFADKAAESGACDAKTKAPYALGRIALFTPSDSKLKVEKLEDLESKDIHKIAIANPEHAPYGLAAKQALEKAGLWSKLEKKLVLAENIQQTLQFAKTGNAEVAIVALSLVAKDKDSHYTLIDSSLHQPLEQTLVVCLHGKNQKGGAEFAAFVNSEDGRAVMRQYGFLLPGEKLVPTP